MRIKCPNSDIVLELPGDRTDMKFTCPACHKIHRVTVTITTPGEDRPPSNTRSMTRATAQMPKKYATGAFAPVVDIPIDANFVLIDDIGMSPQPGIDLGAAAPRPSTPPHMDQDLANRRTEIYERPPSERRHREPTPPPPASSSSEPLVTPPPPSEPIVTPPPVDPTASATAARTATKPPQPDNPEPSRPAGSEDASVKPAPADRITPDAQTATPGGTAGPDAPVDAESENAAADEPVFPGRAASEETAHDFHDEETLRRRDDAPPPPPPPPASVRNAYRDQPVPPRPKKRRSLAGTVVKLFILVALVAAGYLGYQQYQYSLARDRAATLLGWADDAWRKGEVKPAADAAREAGDILRDSGGLWTPGRVWNVVGSETGMFPASPPPHQGDLERVETYLGREEDLESFRRDIRVLDAAETAGVLRGRRPERSGETALAVAMERSAVESSLARLREAAATGTPEEATARAAAERRALAPALSSSTVRLYDDELAAFTTLQTNRLRDELRLEASRIATAGAGGDARSLNRYRDLRNRLARAKAADLPDSPVDLVGNADKAILRQLDELSSIVDDATRSAKTVLSRAEDGEEDLVEGFIRQARDATTPNQELSAAAVGLIEETRVVADELLATRMELFGRLQSEMRRGRDYAGTRLAWSMLRTAFDDSSIEVDPAGFRYDTRSARMAFSIGGMPAFMEMDENDYENTFRIGVAGYRFHGGWPLLFHKPLLWAADLAEQMAAAGVDSAVYPEWELLEGPEGPLALSGAPVTAALSSGSALANPVSSSGGRRVFYLGRLLPVRDLPQPVEALRMVDDFQQAAKRLEAAVMDDESISPQLRQALRPILAGTYEAPDPRDYFDSAFARRLIEADYLETYIDPMPEPIQTALQAYREALGKVEAGFDEFVVDLPDGLLYAVARPEADLSAGRQSDQDPETGETIPRLTWRLETRDETVFSSPLPARYIYAFMLSEHYPGRHQTRPVGVPRLATVRHATRGLIASYRDGDPSATGDAELWSAAISEDSSGRFDPTIGPPGWNYPLYVLQRDDQGDPVRLATLSGVVDSPDFSADRYPDPEERRRAEDEWLTSTAKTFSTPGELGLIFHQFFRYCSDSPLPELPNLIGSHYGYSDTHQTVYQSLERRWVGRLIGDCDDLAEFFQVLTRRQGKLSHVMQLPGHAAAGYVEKGEDDMYRFIVLQTGPVLQFADPDFNEVVETAYRSFDRGEGVSHMTLDAVPLLLRFADEETRTPFVLSARIYKDAEYADTMIEVQSYWHEHAYSSAIEVMEEMVRDDQEVGNIKELGSLYERVGFYDRSLEMRRREYEMVKDNDQQAALSCLMDIAQLHMQNKNRTEAIATLGEMETTMNRMIQNDDAPEFFKAMMFRSYWAMLLSRLGQPERAWNLVRYDVTMTKRQLNRIADPVLRTLVVMHERMCRNRDLPGASLDGDAERAYEEVRKELDEAFGRGYFRQDDSNTTIIGRYFLMGRYAVADAGRDRGLARLLEDGPYPTEQKDHTKRLRGLEDEDWRWFRISPQLYLASGMEMLDQDEYPELYDPARARPLLEDVGRAIQHGTGLGSDFAGSDDAIKAELALSFLNNDIDAFRRTMHTVKEKNYSSLYDDAANTFGFDCGFIPLADFPEWAKAYSEFFPGSQHYFKVVYRAIDKEHYDHALEMAEMTVRFFPDNELLRKELDFVRSVIPTLKARKASRQQNNRMPGNIEVIVPAA